MPFFEDIGKKITNMSQSAIEKTKCSTETLRLNNQIREEQHLCKDLYQLPIRSKSKSKKLRLPSQLFLLLTIVVQYAVHRFRQILNSVQLVEQK